MATIPREWEPGTLDFATSWLMAMTQAERWSLLGMAGLGGVLLLLAVFRAWREALRRRRSGPGGRSGEGRCDPGERE